MTEEISQESAPEATTAAVNARPATQFTPNPQEPKARANTPKKAPVRRAPRDAGPKSMPFMEQTAVLKSFHAQQVWKRSFDIGDEALFSLSVILRAIAPEADCVEADKIVTEKLDAASKALQDEQLRLEKLADSFAVSTASLQYSAPITISAKVKSPRAIKLLGLVREFDHVVELFDILWLSHAITDGDHSKGVFGLKRKLWRLTNDLRTLAIRSIAAAQRKGMHNVDDPRSGTLVEAVTKEVKAPAHDATEAAAANEDEAQLQESPVAAVA